MATQEKQREMMTEDEDIFAKAEDLGKLDESDRMGGTSGDKTPGMWIAQSSWPIEEVAKNAGKLAFQDRQEQWHFYDAIEVIPLESRRKCAREAGGSIVCQSYDGAKSTDGHDCSKCEWRAFSDNHPKEERCKNKFRVLCVRANPETEEDEEPFFLHLSAASIKPTTKAFVDVQNKHKRPAFSVVWRLSAEFTKHAVGQSHVAVWTPVRALGKDETEIMRAKRITESERFGGGNGSGEQVEDPNHDPFENE